MSAQLLRIRIDNILKFMAPHWSWVNCHMVNYLTDDHWKTFVPLELQGEITSQDCIDKCIEKVFWNFVNNPARTSSDFPQLTLFCQETLQNSLHHFKEVVKTLQQFEGEMLEGNNDLRQQIPIKEFLTEKKRHEVSVAKNENDSKLHKLFTNSGGSYCGIN